jgi:DNA-binding transcriptional ArsR family regulator
MFEYIQYNDLIMQESSTTIILKALADDTRLEIVRCLAKTKTPQRSCDITASCPCIADLSQPTKSHHFTKLAAAGILITKKSGTENLYVLNRPHLSSIGINVNKI